MSTHSHDLIEHGEAICVVELPAEFLSESGLLLRLLEVSMDVLLVTNEALDDGDRVPAMLFKNLLTDILWLLTNDSDLSEGH